MERFVRRYAESLGEREARSSANQLRKILRDVEPDEVEAALRQRVDEWEAGRATKVGRRESQRAGNAFYVEALAGLGWLSMRWAALGDTCPLCTSMDGMTVGVRSVFLQKGQRVEGDDSTPDLVTSHAVHHPPLHDGCDCMLVPG